MLLPSIKKWGRYFIVINHADGRTNLLLLYRVIRRGKKVRAADDDTATIGVPEISVE